MHFGITPTNEFCFLNDVDFIVRAHQVAYEGYQEWFDGKLFTVWSAPDYCYRTGNKASVMRYDGPGRHSFSVFTAVPASERVLPPSIASAPRILGLLSAGPGM
eukprot:gnl/Ergobibamus_cyprinoides/1234.p5 GENE.gnl/Ergobibamus_cyprinoides/1234~~gnl/Ergobibamus_cyprinoides/1234.p5  ORF type:complete len:103 (+),score=27.80 gnl/Ergobibamus_cyprinoides/1234:329-637(+)